MARLRAMLAGALVLLGGASGMTTASGGDSAESSDTSGSTALFSSNSAVASLTRSTLISSVLESQSPAVVWLYAGDQDCPKCEELAAVIESATEKLNSWGVLVTAIDMSTEPKLSKELAFSKSSLMMLKVYHSESTPNPYGGLPRRSEKYIGAFKDARDLQKQVLSAIPDLVESVDVEKESPALKEALAGTKESFAAVLFTEAGKATPFLRVLASVVKGKVAAVQARLPKKARKQDEGKDQEDDKEPLDGLLEGVFEVPGGVPSIPSLVLVDKETGKGSLYEGALDDAKAMMEFVRSGAGIPTESASTSSEGTDGSERKTEAGGLLKLDPESLAVLEDKGVEALVVAFVEGGDVSTIPGWSEATKGLQGQIRAGVFDCGAHPSHCQGAAKKKAPHVRVYPHGRGIDGSNRSVPSVLSASKIEEAVSEAEASLPEILTVIPPGIGPQRTQEALQSFVGTSIMSEGGPMVMFVLSRKEEPNLVVKTVAAEFQSAKIRTLFISQPDQEVMSGLGVTRLPAMVLMFEATDEMEIARPPVEGESAMVTAHYSSAQFGPINHQHVSQFVLSRLSHVNHEAFMTHLAGMSETASLNGESFPPQLEEMLAEHVESETGSPSMGRGRRPAAPFRGVPEATSEAWASIMGEGTGGNSLLTVGVFLLDRYSESFDSALKVAESAAELAMVRLGGRGDGGGGFVWVDAPCQEGFTNALGVSDASEVPVLVVFSPRHQKSARFVGAWEAESLASFLGRVLGGRAPMFPVDDAAPRLDDVVCSERAPPTWLAGGDGEGAGGAEDDDMGDFMAEILAEEAKAKRDLEEEVARGLEELKEAENGAGGDGEAPKKKTKVIKRKKKKSGSPRSEL